MKIGKVLSVLVVAMCINLFSQAFAAKEVIYRNSSNPYLSTSSRYDYLYATPPKHSFGVYGRGMYGGYIMTSSRMRYMHSPSRLKGVRHAARINAYNYQAYNY